MTEGPSASSARSAPSLPAKLDGSRPSPLPFLLDFFPLEGPEQTRVSAFYTSLAEGRLTTTRCKRDALLLWPPRAVCPRCHREDLEWVDLPQEGSIYAFSTVLAGAPLGMESELPFVVGLVDLTGAPLRIFTRIQGGSSSGPTIRQRVRFEPFSLSDGRYFYRFRTVESP
jgi:uncharacterized OB-fold protein